MSSVKADLTLHQLHIFCSVAQADSLTRAAKQLGLAQPTLSQQLAKLEDGIGVRLFDRTLNRMTLTDAGRSLLRRAQFILNDVDEALATLREFSEGVRGIIRLAGLNSILRAVLPGAMTRLAETHPEREFDIHEVAPAETLELLYNRTVHVGLIAAQSVAQSAVSFAQIPVVEDEYALAVPAGLDLYAAVLPPRRIVAVLPSHYQRVEPYRTFLDCLAAAGQALTMPTVLPAPPFMPGGADVIRQVSS